MDPAIQLGSAAKAEGQGCAVAAFMLVKVCRCHREEEPAASVAGVSSKAHGTGERAFN